MNSYEQSPITGGEQKINEYVERVKQGESLDSFQLPPGMREAVENKLKPESTEAESNLAIIPRQYEGLDSESLDFIWTIPEYVDPKKTEFEQKRKSEALAFLRNQENEKMALEEEKIAEKIKIKDLQQELAPLKNKSPKEASLENMSLEEMSQEDFAIYLKDNLENILKEREATKNTNEHTLKLWLKNSLYSLLVARPEIRQQALDNFVGKSTEIDTVPKEKWMPYLGKIKSIKESFDNTDYSGAWLQFNFGDRRNTELDGKRRKGYLTISEKSIEDYSEKIGSIMEEVNSDLKSAGYNGSFKISNNLKQLTNQFDSIVAHGANFDEVTKALDVLKNVLARNGIIVDGEQRGMDEKGLIDTNETASHTQLLAEKIVLGLPIKN